MWVTEISWDSNPPDPGGVPERVRARWMQLAFYLLWKQGATTICWFRLADETPGQDWRWSNQSGLFTITGGEKKISIKAFRLPFVAIREGGRTRVWGHTSARGPVSIERRSNGKWVRIARLRSSGGVFQSRLRLPRKARLRARAEAVVSLERTAR